MALLDYKDLIIDQCDEVYPPSHDTFLLADLAQDIEDSDCLEIGCGTGLVSLVLAGNGNRVVASDLNPHAVKCTKSNARDNDLELEVVEADLFQGIERRRFDIIIFNPPYLPTVEEDRTSDKWQDVATDGGIDGLLVTREFLSQAPDHLKEGGMIYTVVSSLSPEKAVKELLQGFTVVETVDKKHFFETITVYKLTSS